MILTDPDRTVFHISTNNLAEISFCKVQLQTDDKILAPFMRLKSYADHWHQNRHADIVPKFCRECKVSADAALARR